MDRESGSRAGKAIPIDKDHCKLNKCVDREERLYKELVAAIENIIEQSTDEDDMNADFCLWAEEEELCHRCGLRHRREECYAGSRIVSSFRKRKRLCYKCGRLDHWSRDCKFDSDEEL